MTRNLTKGNPLKLILGFSVPLLFGFLFQQFYNLVDTVIVGKMLGPDGLASVGATGSINFLVLGFCMGVCNGFAIPVAHKFGAQDYTGVRKVVANCIYLSAGFAIVLTISTVLLCRSILVWMGTPVNVIGESEEYISIIFLGIPTVFLYNLCAGIIRSLGDSRTPVIFLMISSVVNIGLDLLFMGVLGTGVGGAAFATVLSQALSGMMCLIFILKKSDVLHIKRGEWKAERNLLGKLLGMGVPMGLQYSITAIGSIILQTGTNSLGSSAVAAVTAGGKMNNFFATPFDALGSCMATWAGQNVGAGKIDRVKEGLKKAILLGWIYSMMAFLIILLFGGKLGLLFLDADDVTIIANVKLYITFSVAAYMLLTLINTIRFCIQGMGFANFAILAGVFEMLARAICGLVLVPKLGFIGVCLGSPLAWLFADCFLVPAFFYCYKCLKERFKN